MVKLLNATHLPTYLHTHPTHVILSESPQQNTVVLVHELDIHFYTSGEDSLRLLHMAVLSLGPNSLSFVYM